MKASELRQLSPKKLAEEERDTSRAIAKARFHLKTGQSQNTAELKNLRSKYARIKTVQHNETLKATAA